MSGLDRLIVLFPFLSFISLLSNAAQAAGYVELSDNSPAMAIQRKADEARCDSEFGQALGVVEQLIERYPSCRWFAMEKAYLLIQQNYGPSALRIYQKLGKQPPSEDQCRAELFCRIAEYQAQHGQPEAALDAAVQAICLAPSGARIIETVERVNAQVKNLALKRRLTACRAALPAARNKIAAELKTLGGGRSLGNNEQLEVVLSSECFERFKLTLSNDACLADSGVIKYLICAQDYGKVTLFDSESKNCLTLTVEKLLEDHCGFARTKHYCSIQALAQKVAAGQSVSLYKCRAADGDGFDTIAVAPFKINRALARTIALMCAMPETDGIIVQVDRYVDGVHLDMLKMLSIKKVPLNKSLYRLPKGLTAVKSMGELIYANQGKLQKSDLDSILRSPGK